MQFYPHKLDKISHFINTARNSIRDTHGTIGLVKTLFIRYSHPTVRNDEEKKEPQIFEYFSFRKRY